MYKPKYAQCNETDYKVLDYIWECQTEYKNSPSIGMISNKFEKPCTGVRYCLTKLQTQGFIDWIYVGKTRLIVPLWKR